MRKQAFATCVLALAALGCEERKDVRFRIDTEYGAETDWVEGYLTRAARILVRMMDASDVAPPTEIHVVLKKEPKNPGLGGWATPTEIGFASSVWPDEPWRHWILAHELTNLFAAHYGGAGGYPSDWWSDGRSPFPEYVSCLVMAQLGLFEEAAWRRSQTTGKKDHDLYWAIHKKHGFEPFARFFRLVRADGVDMGKIGTPWPAADAMRSAYTVAYLSLAAGENLATLVAAHDVGKKPSDWEQRHPDKPFAAYEVTPARVDEIIASRKRLFVDRAKDKAAEPLRQKFRAGDPAAK